MDCRKPATTVGERTGEQSDSVLGVEADDVSSDQDLESSRLEFHLALGAIKRMSALSLRNSREDEQFNTVEVTFGVVKDPVREIFDVNVAPEEGHWGDRRRNWKPEATFSHRQ